MQKKTLVLAVLALTPAMAFANMAIQRANREIGIAVGGQSLSYHEYNPMVGVNPLDSESGKQPAIEVNFGLQGRVFGSKDWYMHLRLDYAQGETHYQGYTQNLVTANITPLSTSTHNDTYAGTFSFGKGFEFGSDCQIQLTPELVYSYDEWHRSTGINTGVGYLEVYKHQAAGVGVLGQWAFGRLVVGAEVTGEKTFSATVSSPFATSASLGGRYANSESLDLDYRVSRSQHLTLAFEHSHFLYGHSAILNSGGTLVQEPNSVTNLNSIYGGWAWSF
jgi:hypothetical protein